MILYSRSVRRLRSARKGVVTQCAAMSTPEGTGRTALVTGASPGSIAFAIVRLLLERGARGDAGEARSDDASSV